MSSQDLIFTILPRDPNAPTPARNQMYIGQLNKKQRVDTHKSNRSDVRRKSLPAPPDKPVQTSDDHQVDEFV
jgi:hypothetical protein